MQRQHPQVQAQSTPLLLPERQNLPPQNGTKPLLEPQRPDQPAQVKPKPQLAPRWQLQLQRMSKSLVPSLQQEMQKRLQQGKSPLQLEPQKQLQPLLTSFLPPREARSPAPSLQASPAALPQIQQQEEGPQLDKQRPGPTQGVRELLGLPALKRPLQHATPEPRADAARNSLPMTAQQSMASHSTATASQSLPQLEDDILRLHNRRTAQVQAHAALGLSLDLERKLRGGMIRADGTYDTWLARNSFECSAALMGKLARQKESVRDETAGICFKSRTVHLQWSSKYLA